jgi:DNA-directed RNA polymerase subunit RPC12/RpoP
MIMQEFKGTLTTRYYCENCEAEYMAISDDDGCPVCVFNKLQKAKKAEAIKKTKGGGKDA